MVCKGTDQFPMLRNMYNDQYTPDGTDNTVRVAPGTCDLPLRFGADRHCNQSYAQKYIDKDFGSFG